MIILTQNLNNLTGREVYAMGMTIAEKILASHSQRKEVKPGEYIWARVDETTMADVVAEFSPTLCFERLGIDKVFDPDRIYARTPHPPTSIGGAEGVAEMRRFVKKYGITHWFDYGRHGIVHQLNPEHGYVRPGELIAMHDSHSTSYGAFNAASCGIHIEQVYIMAMGQLWFRVPESIKFQLVGKLPNMCVGKDVILKIAADYGTDVALYKSVEFLGPVALLAGRPRWSKVLHR